MAKFICLTERSNPYHDKIEYSPIYVNVDRICKFYTRVSSKDHKSYTTLIIDSGTYDVIKVSESIGEILSQIYGEE